MLKTKVKASQITNLTDARYFAAWNVDYIGFQLEQGNEKYISPTEVKAMKEWLEGPQFIGEFGSVPDVQQVSYLYQQLNLDGVQMGTLCHLDIIKEISQLNIPIIKEIIWNENSSWETLEQEYQTFQPFVTCFLLDFSVNNIDNQNLTAQIQTISSFHPTLVDAPIQGENINLFLDATQVFGLAIKGGEEEKVGYKSFDEMDDLFEALTGE